MKVFPENLSADKTTAQLLACWDYTTPLSNNQWQGKVSPVAQQLFNNTPIQAMASTGGSGIGGAVLRPSTSLWMDSSFYRVYDSVSFVFQLGNYTTPNALNGGSFIAIDTVSAQPIKAGGSKYYDYLGMTYLSGGPNYPMPSGGPSYLDVVNNWQPMNEDDWVAISICFAPPTPGANRGPYILIGDSANRMLAKDLYRNPTSPESGWVNKLEDIKNGFLSVDAIKLLLSYGPSDVYVKGMAIYGGMVNAIGLNELKISMR